jgi:hypothetical protein
MNAEQQKQFNKLSELFRLPFKAQEPNLILGAGDEHRWSEVWSTYQNSNKSNTLATLYLVKIKRLSDNQYFYKVGITRQTVFERFLYSESPDIGFVGSIASHTADESFIRFAEYQFIRAFRSDTEDFDGGTELINQNSVDARFIKLLSTENKTVFTAKILDVSRISGSALLELTGGRWSADMQLVVTNKGVFINPMISPSRGPSGRDWSSYVQSGEGVKVKVSVCDAEPYKWIDLA